MADSQLKSKVFPPAPPRRSGWPWAANEASPPPSLPEGQAWPRISIVTPSYNQGQFLEETIRSVLLQGYPNLEYIIMDGGSTDNSTAIIKKYEPWLTYWVSEKDNGQADAIHRGFKCSTGEIFAWINSDDYLLPDALYKVCTLFAATPSIEFVIGGGIVVDAFGRFIRKRYSFAQDFDSLLFGGQFFLQMSSFWRRDAYEATGGLDTSLRFCFDYDLFLRLVRRKQPLGLDALLSAFRINDHSKTSTIWESVAIPEIATIRDRYGFGSIPESSRTHLSAETISEFYRVTRMGILKDLFRDPKYFLRCLRNKLIGQIKAVMVTLSLYC